MEVARAVLLGYQPTLLPGGTQTRPKGLLVPFNPLAPLMTVHVFTFVCKRDAGGQSYNTNNLWVLLVRGAGDNPRNRQPYTPVIQKPACTHLRRTNGHGAHPVSMCHGKRGPCVLWKSKPMHGPLLKNIKHPYAKPSGWMFG